MLRIWFTFYPAFSGKLTFWMGFMDLPLLTKVVREKLLSRLSPGPYSLNTLSNFARVYPTFIHSFCRLSVLRSRNLELFSIGYTYLSQLYIFNPSATYSSKDNPFPVKLCSYWLLDFVSIYSFVTFGSDFDYWLCLINLSCLEGLIDIYLLKFRAPIFITKDEVWIL